MKASSKNSLPFSEYRKGKEHGKSSPWPVRRGLIPERGPKRPLALVSFVNMLGSSAFLVSASLFYTHSAGLSLPKVGIGLGLAALVGVLAGIPAGRLADRRGPREVYRLTLLIQALATAALVLVHGFVTFTAAVCLAELASAASRAARAPLVRGFGGPEVARFRAYLRAVVNLAGGVGALAAGLAVQLGTRPAYDVLVLADAASYAVCAVAVASMPHLPPSPAAPRRRRPWVALADRSYVVVCLLDGLLWMQGSVLVFALPLWIVDFTRAPRWFVGVTALVNTTMVVALQVRASRGIAGAPAATRALRRAGAAFLTGMAVIAAAAGTPGWLAVTVLLVGIALHTAGELWHAAASLELRVRLAPAHAQGEYAGVYGLGRGLAGVLAPSLLGLLCIRGGAPGWWATGGLFLGIGLMMRPAVRWAERTRPPGAA